jgi:plastocyanin
MRVRGVAIALATTVGVLLSAAGAQAATKTVMAGPPVAKAPKGVAKDADTNQFYRRTITIHVGDKVSWKFAGFHTVAIPAKGDGPPPLAIGDPAHPITAANDAANAPFWFNGQPRIIFNPVVLAPTGGKRYDGTKLVTAGLPLGPPKPFKVRFTKAGTFTYYCPIHLGTADMKGKVRVLRAGKRVPTAKQDRKAAGKQFAKAVKQVKRDAKKAAPAGNVVRAGVDSAVSALFRFSPARKTVKVGDTLTFAMSPTTSEVHTITFAPDAYLKTLAEGGIAPQSPDQALGFDPLLAYPSDLPVGGVLTHTKSSHGNGFVNTGIIDRDKFTPMGPTMRVKFTEVGTFGYICLIHPDMRGQVVVAP